MSETSIKSIDYDLIVKILKELDIILISKNSKYEIGEEISIETINKIVNLTITKLETL